MSRRDFLNKKFATIYNNVHCCIHLPNKSYCSIKNQGISFGGDLNRLKMVLEVKKMKRIPIIDITDMNIKDIMDRNYHLGKRVN